MEHRQHIAHVERVVATFTSWHYEVKAQNTTFGPYSTFKEALKRVEEIEKEERDKLPPYSPYSSSALR